MKMKQHCTARCKGSIYDYYRCNF